MGENLQGRLWARNMYTQIAMGEIYINQGSNNVHSVRPKLLGLFRS